MKKEDAVNYGVTGPNLRACGVDWDLRKNKPYSIYDRFSFKTAVGDGRTGAIGDSWNRYYVRMVEVEESVKIARQALASLPGGDFRTKVPRVLKLPAGESYFAVENPKGELGFYIVSSGESKPYRLKLRGPSFNNLSILSELGRGHFMADLIAIVGSLDFVLGEVDR